MGKIISLILFVTLFLSLVSAEIIISQQPEEFYNMGDFVKTSFNIVTSEDLELDAFFTVDMICNGIETQVLKQSVGDMQAGDEKEFDVSVPLLTSLLGRTSGVCKVKAVLGATSGEEYDYQLTNEFEISDLIVLKLLSAETTFKPGEQIVFEGKYSNDVGAFQISSRRVVYNNSLYYLTTAKIINNEIGRKQ